MRAERLGGIGLCIVMCAMFLWTLLGNPQYSFYAVMKWCFAGSCCYLAWITFRISRVMVALDVVLLGLGGIHVVGRMRRADWIPFNWAAVATLVICGVLLGISSVKAEPMER
ncbi:MAG: hypothetical protein ABL962_09760 [Fimbriimonadaceae bacterium]